MIGKVKLTKITWTHEINLWICICVWNSIKESDIVFDEFREYLFHEKNDKPDGYIGCLGYPNSASAKKGKILVEKMIERVINEYYTTQ